MAQSDWKSRFTSWVGAGLSMPLLVAGIGVVFGIGWAMIAWGVISMAIAGGRKAGAFAVGELQALKDTLAAKKPKELER